MSVLDKPVHRPQDILLGRLAHRVLLVVGEDHHVLSLVTEVLDEVRRHVPDIVDAPPELPSLAKVVDPHQERLPPTRAVGVYKRVAVRRTCAKVLWPAGRRRRHGMVAVNVRV